MLAFVGRIWARHISLTTMPGSWANKIDCRIRSFCRLTRAAMADLKRVLSRTTFQAVTISVVRGSMSASISEFRICLTGRTASNLSFRRRGEGHLLSGQLGISNRSHETEKPCSKFGQGFDELFKNPVAIAPGSDYTLTVYAFAVIVFPLSFEVFRVFVRTRTDADNGSAIFDPAFIDLCSLLWNSPAD